MIWIQMTVMTWKMKMITLLSEHPIWLKLSKPNQAPPAQAPQSLLTLSPTPLSPCLPPLCPLCPVRPSHPLPSPHPTAPLLEMEIGPGHLTVATFCHLLELSTVPSVNKIMVTETTVMTPLTQEETMIVLVVTMTMMMMS
uniref:Uncharacterized protein n=1 Tax=Cacopsylla melanoneura TaxID=428564 RepID=A0A8D9B940_9HEMI